MSFTVFLGNLPVWVTADDIKQWLSAEDLVADSVKVIRNHETQESKGFAFVEAPTADEMQAIIRRFDRAPLEDKVLRANPAQPSKGVVKGPGGSQSAAQSGSQGASQGATQGTAQGASHGGNAHSPAGANGGPSRSADRAGAAGRSDRRGGAGKKREQEPKSAFATELAKVL
jgi:RNA recognition motif-containing protein